MCNRVDGQNDSVRRLSPNQNTMRHRFSEPGTFMWSCWRMLIAPNSVPLRHWCLSASFYREICGLTTLDALTSLPTDCKTDYIFLRSTSTIATQHIENARTRWRLNKDAAKDVTKVNETRSFAMLHRHFTPDCTWKLTEHKWQPLLQRDWADSFSKLMFPKTGPFWIIEILPSTVITDEDSISKSESIEPVTSAPILVSIQDVVEDTNIGNRDGLLADAIRQDVHTKNTMLQNVIYNDEKNTKKSQCERVKGKST